LSLADKSNRMLYELRPDLLPPFLTDLEVLLWSRYYERENKRNERRIRR
jgi:hypothetical protein